MNTSYTLLFKSEARPYVNTTRWILIILKILLIPVLAIILIPYWWVLAIILAVVSLIEYRALRSIPAVYFSDVNIVFKGIMKRSYPWSSIANVILKDGLLTVDFTDNRLFQKETEGKTNEQEFNDWCSKKLG